jgi:hypothetical protein
MALLLWFGAWPLVAGMGSEVLQGFNPRGRAASHGRSAAESGQPWYRSGAQYPQPPRCKKPREERYAAFALHGTGKRNLCLPDVGNEL